MRSLSAFRTLRHARQPFLFAPQHLLLFLLFITLFSFPFASATNIPSVICPSDPLAAAACNASASDSACPAACQCAACPSSPVSRCYKTALFQGSSTGDVLGSFLIFLVSVFSSVAGIGGGAMMTPILMSVFGFGLSAAKMLSHIAVFGNVCAQVNAPHRICFAASERARVITLSPFSVPHMQQVGSSFLPSMRRASGASIDALTVTIVAPTFLLGHMFGLSVFPTLNDALVEGLLSAVLVLAGTLRCCSVCLSRAVRSQGSLHQYIRRL
jgi:hypothetical protein